MERMIVSKRTFTCFLLVLLLLGTLTGCASSQAKKVSTQIDQIGVITLTSNADITAAEEAYAALSEAAQGKVENYGKLTAARESYDRMTNVYQLIESIGTVSENSESAIVKAEEAYHALTMEERTGIINYATLTAARVAYDAIPKVIELTMDNVRDYFDIGCSLSTSKSKSYGVTAKYTTNATITLSAKLAKTVDALDSVSITAKATYSLDKDSYGTTKETVTVTVRPDAISGKGSASYGTKSTLIEKIGGPSLYYPEYTLVGWEITEVSGTVSAK